MIKTNNFPELYIYRCLRELYLVNESFSPNIVLLNLFITQKIHYEVYRQRMWYIQVLLIFWISSSICSKTIIGQTSINKILKSVSCQVSITNRVYKIEKKKSIEVIDLKYFFLFLLEMMFHKKLLSNKFVFLPKSGWYFEVFE